MSTPAASRPPSTPASATAEAEAAFAEAADLKGIGRALAALAPSLPGCRSLGLLWSLAWPGERQAEPRSALSAEWLALADRAVACDEACVDPRGRKLALPLCVRGDGPAAVLSCRLDDRIDRDAWLQRNDVLLRAIAARVALALDNAHLRDELGRLEQADRLQRALFAIADMAGSDLDMPEMLRGLHRIVAGLMYAENFYIALHEPAGDAIRFLYYADVADDEPPVPDSKIPLSAIERGLTWYLIRDGRPLMGPTHALRRQVSGPLRIHGADSHDFLGVPMLRGAEVRGVVVVQSYDATRSYSSEDQTLLAFVANHILTALERKRSQAELELLVGQRTSDLARANAELALEVEERQRAGQLQATLYRIAELSAGEDSGDAFFAAIHASVANLLIAENFYVALLDETGTALSFPYFCDEAQAPPLPRPLGRSVTEYALRHGTAQLLDRDDMEQLQSQGEIERSGAPAESWLGVPLSGSEGVFGVVAVQSYDRAIRYDRSDQELLTFVAHKIGNSLERRRAVAALREANARLEQRVEERTRELRAEITERERVELELKHEVVHDALTTLPNRRYLRDRLERVLARQRRRPESRSAVLYLDVDRFKVINDSLGHVVGDAVLREVADRLDACVREPDVVARLGGDEFAVLLEELADTDAAIRVARRIIAALARPVEVAERQLSTSASIGICYLEPRHGNADEVLRDADVAMYRAKRRGKNRYELFDQELHRASLDVLELEHDLRRATSAGEFEPWLQPLVRLGDQSVIGYEALLRWNHPRRGVLAPDAFLLVAEDIGCIEAIDWQVFGASCRAAASLADPDAFICINVSPRHFRDDDFDKRLLETIATSGARPQQLRIEITEGTLLAHEDQVRLMLGRLNRAGVMSALDDFGTGHSSLARLHRLPLQILKIDRSFVAALDGDDDDAGIACVRTILALAGSLGMEVVAEGIETETQRRCLIELGCRLGQGFLMARPQPISHWLGPEVAVR